MAGLLGYAAAGAVAGLGAGLVEEGKAARDRAMRMLEHQNRLAIIDETDRRAAAREEARDVRMAEREEAREKARAEREGGLLASVQQTDDGRLIGFTRSGEVIEYKYKGKAKPEDLVEVGDPDSPTGSRYVPKSQAAGQPGKFSNDALDTYHNRQKTEWEDARRQAEREASDKAKWFSTDETDFADDGGSRSAFIERRTNEILRERKRQNSSAAPSRNDPSHDKDGRPPKPTEYPDARWSDRAGAWVVQRDGKWFAVE